MTKYLGPDDRRNEAAGLTGPELGACYCDLYDDVAWLHFKWEQQEELFGRDEARIALLSQTGPLFFGLVQTVLFEDVLLHLARLVDQAESRAPRGRRRDNLTFRRLAPLVPDGSLRAKTDAALGALTDRCAFAVDWRNRRLAHTDLQTFRGQPPKPLEFASRQRVAEALAAMRGLLNVLEEHYYGGAIAYDFLPEAGGAELVVEYLAVGLEARETQRSR